MYRLSLNYKNMVFLIFGLLLSVVVCESYCADNLIPRDVLFGHDGTFKPAISPDGTQLAYLAPVEGVLNIWVKTVGKNDDRLITHVTARDIRNFFWGFDGASLYYLQDDKGDENWNIYGINLATGATSNLTPFADARVEEFFQRRAKPDQLLFTMNKEDKRFFDAYVLDLKTKNITMVEKNPGNVIRWIVDRELQVRACVKTLEDGSSSLLVKDTLGAPWRELLVWGFDDARISTALRFTYDGQGLYCIDSTNSDTAAMVLLDIATGKKTVIASDATYDVNNIFLHPTTYKPLACIIDKERQEIVAVDESIAQDLKAIRSLDHGDILFQSFDEAFNRWVIAFEKDNGPLSYYLYDRTTRAAQFLFDTKPRLRNYTLAKMEPVTLKARDGLPLHGYITHATHKPTVGLPPLLLVVHGGPAVRDTWGYDAEIQWFANRGITCLQINYRGSTGYGKEFIKACIKERGRKMLYDIIDGAEWAIKEGIADPEKIGIYGWSYGGYSALAAATFTPDVFCCAIDGCGVSNLISFYQSIPPYWANYMTIMKKQVGDLETDRDMLIERSPLFKVDAIKIPMFIVQGAHDPRIKQAESEQIVAAMKAKNIPYEYMLFENEGHGLAREDNKMLFHAKLEKFLAEYLGSRYEA